MIDFIFKLIFAILASTISSVLLCVIYFFIAAGIVNVLGLNRGERNFGYHFFNAALIATALSFFLIFAFFMRG